MNTIGLQKYHSNAAYSRVLELLKKEKGNPLSLEDISSELNLDLDTVVHVIHSIQDKFDLCQKNNKFYFAQNKMIWWPVAFGLMIVVVYTVCGYIKYYNL